MNYYTKDFDDQLDKIEIYQRYPRSSPLLAQTTDAMAPATWQLDYEEDYEAIKGSDFKLKMMELLDILSIYRASHGQPDPNQGVIHMHSGLASPRYSRRLIALH